ncbi:MAG TPA: RDD family protein [Archangium sp.]
MQSHHALVEDAASTAVVAAHDPQPQSSTAVLPPHRAEPPSPTAFAQARQPLPQVTPASPTMGAVIPEGQMTAVARTEPTQRPAPVAVIDDTPEPLTVPAAPVARIPTPQAAPPPKPAVLPPSMLVTQPGLPGPFAAAREIQENPSIPQRPASLPELPRVAEPASMPEAPVFDDPVAAREDVVTAEPASLWRRTGAWLADLTFVVGLVLGFLFIAMTVIAPKNLSPVQQLLAVAAPGGALAAVLAFVYTTIFAFLWNGRTPGRRIFGIHLVDVSGHAPAPARALLRALLSLVSFGLFLSGFWLALFDRHGQTLHDKLTRTFVVKLQDA